VNIRRVSVHGRKRWMVDARLAGERLRETFASRTAAAARVRDLKEQVAATGQWFASLSAARRAELVAVAQEVEKAGLTLANVWRAYQDGIPAPEKAPTATSWGAAATECAAAKLAAGRSAAYCDGLFGELDRFGRTRPNLPLGKVTTADLEAHLAQCGKSLATRAAVLSRLSAFLSWAVRRGYLKTNPADAIERVTVPARAPRILSPAEAKALLAAVPVRSLAWMVLGLFAGVRPQEADQLTWAAIDPLHGHLTIDAAASKVRRRRIVPLAPAAVAWLEAAKRLGSALPLAQVTRRRDLRATRDAMGWPEWPADVLRHTAASYWLARDRDAARVADALGHSPAILYRHYREIVSPAAAAEFWALRPPGK
jgi:integrase